MARTHKTREAWLQAAVKALTPLFKPTGMTVPADLQVSAGFPGGGSPRRRIGECWPTTMANGTNALFISPVLSDPVKVLDVLLHEMIHAADNCKSSHAGAFTRAARTLGLEGKPTSTVAGPELAAKLAKVADRLGPYPHNAVKLGARLTPKQSTRMIKVTCPEDGYVARTTRKWLDDMGAPSCPCGEVMQED